MLPPLRMALKPGMRLRWSAPSLAGAGCAEARGSSTIRTPWSGRWATTVTRSKVNATGPPRTARRTPARATAPAACNRPATPTAGNSRNPSHGRLSGRRHRQPDFGHQTNRPPPATGQVRARLAPPAAARPGYRSTRIRPSAGHARYRQTNGRRSAAPPATPMGFAAMTYPISPMQCRTCTCSMHAPALASRAYCERRTDCNRAAHPRSPTQCRHRPAPNDRWSA